VSPRGRAVVSAGLSVIAALALVAALAASYVRQVAVDSDQFADRATVALQAPSVRSLVAEKVTDDLVLRHADDLLAARPLIESVVSSAVGSQAFGSLFRAGVGDLHRAVFQRDEHTVTLTVADVGTVAASALDVLKPSLARRLRAQQRVTVFRDDLGTLSTTALRITDRVRLLAVLLGLLALLAAAGAIVTARDRRRAITGLGVASAVAGVLLVVAWGVGRTLAADHVAAGQDHDAVVAVWGAFLGDLRTEAWIVAGAGAVIAAASASLLRPAPIDAPLRALGRWVVAEPRRPWSRGLRALALIAVGAACVFDHGAVISLAFTAVGVYLIYGGVAILLGLINQPLLSVGGHNRSAPDPHHGLERIPGRRIAVAAIVAIVVCGAAVGGFLGSGALSAAAPGQAPCDGSRLLCDRPLTAVALPATHNSMSVPLPGWFSAEQDAPIPAQLDAGIRGLLIDTHYATRLPGGKLRTDLNGELSGPVADEVSPQAQRAAQRLRARLGFAGHGTRSIYLCHTFCELGGTPLSTVLDQIHDFLVANPSQVLVIINQDYVKPSDFTAAVDAAGLGSMAYRGPTAGHWPTLQQMIDSDQRVVFLAENHAGGAPWYHLAYRSITEETPYTFKRAAQLTDAAQRATSCRSNRGPARGAPLFLVNGWVSTDPLPLPSNAAKVNAESPLLARLRACERVRHHIPNLVAVNFYREGDVFKAVDALNGVTPPDR
jgi:hypothetical protein